jgi:tetratricopeptide (TPR) repeat protein
LWIDLRRPKLPADDLTLALKLKWLGECRLTQKKYPEAEKVLQECLAIYAKNSSEAALGHESMSLLGAALAGQNKYAEAEPLLLRSANALKADAAKLPPARRAPAIAAIERVIDLYDAWNRSDQAVPWQKELPKLKAK